MAIQLIVCGQFPRTLADTFDWFQQALLIIRIYAIYGRKRWVVWLLLGIVGTGLPVICVRMVILNWCRPNDWDNSKWSILSNAPIAVSQVVQSAQGCSEPLGSEQSVSQPFALCIRNLIFRTRGLRKYLNPLSTCDVIRTCLDLAITWSGQLVFDATCFVLTVRKTFTIGRTSHQSSVLHILLRDGECKLVLWFLFISNYKRK